MSDEKFLGKALYCIPRKTFVLLIAAWTFFGAILESSYLVFIKWMLQGRPLTPQHCSGHVCTQVATCVGLTSGTYDFHRAVALIGGIVFGYTGLSGTWNGDSKNLQTFSAFLLFKAAIVASCGGIDTGFYFACDAYAYNVVAESVLFPWPNWPMSEAQKLQITEGPRWFPNGFMHDEVHEATIWPLYLTIIVLQTLLLVYTANQASFLAEHCYFGVFGLGANYEVRKWREDKMFKDRVRGWIEYAKEDIRTTFTEDVPIYRSTA